ncbi:transposase [Streptomyces caeruleatus]
MVQELIEAEASAHIGAEWNEHTPTRTNVRNGHRDKEPFQRGHRSSDAGVMRWVCATDRAPVPLREVFDVSTQQHRSPVGSVSCRTRPASRSGRVSLNNRVKLVGRVAGWG